MASLNTLRTRFGVVLSIIIAFALLAFILSLKTDMGLSGNDPKVGVIDGSKIRYSEYIEVYNNLKDQSNISESNDDELTRWRDPKVQLPNDNRDVLVKTTLCREYCIAFYKANGGRNHHWHENNGSLDDDMVIGWRPILEKE